ncbi:MAG TPA: hypothetical protein VG711_07895 [Phycisphaerales bacterium]|nr:hypothetical protein [Phycisphaerales bacterium]
MGQLALGFRSLLIKAAVFFIMASLLAWALGGTLWPRAQTHELPHIQHNGATWFWRISIGGSPKEHLRCQLMVQKPGERPHPFDERLWSDVANPVELNGALYYGGCLIDGTPGGNWRIEKMKDLSPAQVFPLPDRLALDQQMARISHALPVQSPEEIQSQRPIVLDPKIGTADTH